MKLTFLGTRGNINAWTRRHRMHAAALVAYHGQAVMIDCGEDWLGQIEDVSPEAIVVTHAHPDHAWGLKEGAPCPVYATQGTWESMEGFDIQDQRAVTAREPVEIGGITFEAFPVLHSTRAPAVGYRVTAGAVAIFYVPDVAWIEDRPAALQGTKVYVGDGATVERSMVRKPGDVIIGHVPLRTQLTWCQKEGVGRAIFTHCGSRIVKGDERTLGAEIRRMARQRGVAAEIAHDSMEIVLR
jgi:phosphoribosyl 1,2-cyclic phosphodiesterase